MKSLQFWTSLNRNQVNEVTLKHQKNLILSSANAHWLQSALLRWTKNWSCINNQHGQVRGSRLASFLSWWFLYHLKLCGSLYFQKFREERLWKFLFVKSPFKKVTPLSELTCKNCPLRCSLLMPEEDLGLFIVFSMAIHRYWPYLPLLRFGIFL